MVENWGCKYENMDWNPGHDLTVRMRKLKFEFLLI